ncbi:predicted protein [Arabidopsis lyrata subsp. lyrata]|uniref:Predicted protein n=1 Tax=Arabidopsis lyrata subsp. lyrata TaxID=81972 RepID=D7KT04_ARALL|nr:predicted protein [Arabidopsis lyrata subsp. lyrata]
MVVDVDTLIYTSELPHLHVSQPKQTLVVNDNTYLRALGDSRERRRGEAAINLAPIWPEIGAKSAKERSRQNRHEREGLRIVFDFVTNEKRFSLSKIATNQRMTRAHKIGPKTVLAS